ncbi:MAG: hypothetical protein Q4P23_08625, partial [Micrococcaceae bacterium]|nr:hypothetical protein [Micrococcaceae bacterium]
MPAAHEEAGSDEGRHAAGNTGPGPDGADGRGARPRVDGSSAVLQRVRRNRAVAGWLVMGLIAAAAVLPTHFVVESAG